MLQILIMEDDLVDQMALDRVLTKNFPTSIITYCTNVEDTKALLEKNNYDWVLSDFNLPDGTIFDILPYSSKVKMICLTGATDKESISDLKAGGLHKFFIKDQKLSYLNKIVNEINVLRDEKLEVEDNFSEDSNIIYNILLANFGGEKDICLEIIEMLLSQTIEVEFNLLKDALTTQNAKQTKFHSHKMQSSFRIIKAAEILKKLQNIEWESNEEKVNWRKLKDEFLELSDLVPRIKTILLETQEALKNN